MNISLTEHFEKFVAGLVESGRYGNSSEVIRAALRLLEDDDKRISARFQAAIDQGISELDTGNGIQFDAEDIKREGRRQLAEQSS